VRENADLRAVLPESSSLFAKRGSQDYFRYLKQFEEKQRLVLSVSDSIRQIADGERRNFAVAPTSRLDALFRNIPALDTLRGRISEMFNLFPVIDATHGQLALRFSRTAPPEGLERSISPENEAFMLATQNFTELSDGTKTYIGLWGHLLSGSERLIFLDEAGAFLHPPLARKLGKQLTQLAVERRGHVFAATHSPDFVLGCVQAGCQANVIRLTYRDGVSTARLLSSNDLVPLMQDPLLRSANILSGLFHDGVVVCEADADRAFYQEINERLLDESQGLDSCHFVNAQNWQTIPRIASALRRLGVPTVLLVDLDAVLHENTGMLLAAANIPEAISRGLGQLRGDLAKHVVNRKSLKAEGLSIFSGEIRESWDKYLEDLADYGIFAVPVGELEGWLPELTVARGRKADWIVDMFSAMGSDPKSPSYVRPAVDGPWEFMRKVSRWILNPRRRGMPDLASGDAGAADSP
jgi:hypothetical protein